MFDFKGKSGRQKFFDKFLDLVALDHSGHCSFLGENR